jgi:carbon storage regulator CsrA
LIRRCAILVLSRFTNERIFVDEGRIIITVVEIRGGRLVRLGINAPGDVRIDREEIFDDRLRNPRLEA